MKVKAIKVYAVIEQVVEAEPEEIHGEIRRRKADAENFTGTLDLQYNQGGLRNSVMREHVPLTMQELDAVLEARNGRH